VTLNRRAVVLNRGRIVYDAPHTDAATFPALYRELVQEERGKRQESANQESANGELVNGQIGESAEHASRIPPTHNPLPATRHFFRQVWAIVAKDIAAELHTREIFSAMFVFAVLALLIFSFALDLRGSLAQAAAPGVLWATIAFAGTLGLSRSMAREQQTGGIEGLLLAPVDRAAIFFGKALGNLTLMLAVEVVLIPLAMLMFNVGLLRGGVLFTALLGTVAYAAVGTLLSAIAVNTRAREVMLPILLLPLLTPLLIAAVKATGALLEGATWAEIGGWGQILVVYNLLIIAVALLTFGYVIEE